MDELDKILEQIHLGKGLPPIKTSGTEKSNISRTCDSHPGTRSVQFSYQEAPSKKEDEK